LTLVLFLFRLELATIDHFEFGGIAHGSDLPICLNDLFNCY
jgi:hypothetical protein